jgi:hypothetical protein
MSVYLYRLTSTTKRKGAVTAKGQQDNPRLKKHPLPIAQGRIGQSIGKGCLVSRLKLCSRIISDHMIMSVSGDLFSAWRGLARSHLIWQGPKSHGPRWKRLFLETPGSIAQWRTFYMFAPRIPADASIFIFRARRLSNGIHIERCGGSL